MKNPDLDQVNPERPNPCREYISYSKLRKRIDQLINSNLIVPRNSDPNAFPQARRIAQVQLVKRWAIRIGTSYETMNELLFQAPEELPGEVCAQLRIYLEEHGLREFLRALGRAWIKHQREQEDQDE